MIGQPQRHRRRAVVIAMHALSSRQPQGRMSPLEVVIEELQADQGIESGIAEGFGMRLASQGIEPIPQGTVEPFHMHRASRLHGRPQRGADLYAEEMAVLIAMLDGLRQGERLWHDEPRTPALARAHRLPIGASQDVPIAVPAITEPGEGTLVSSREGGGHGSLDQVLAQWTGGTGDDEATVAILHQASPALSLVRLASCPLFFCTNDQNSSIST